jgi:HK97 gp10 family phage protein
MNTVVLDLNTRSLINYLERSINSVDAATAKLLRRLSQEGTREAKRHTPKAESTLTNSIRAKQQSASFHQVVAGVHYARYVEEGTGRGGWVPDQTILDWMDVKGITPDDEEMSIEQLAYLIQTKIFYRGTPAQPFMKPALEHIKSKAPNLALTYFKSALEVKTK